MVDRDVSGPRHRLGGIWSRSVGRLAARPGRCPAAGLGGTRVFRFAGVEVGPGARRIVKLSVTMMATGQPLEIPVHILAGDAPRPVAALLSTHHGDEVFTIEVLRAVSQALTRARPNGTVLLIPVANPIAFE